MSAGLICVFAKAPVPGRVKTRLIPELGAERAALLAEAGLRDTWALITRCALKLTAQTRLLLDGSPEQLPTLTPHPQILQQSAGDLGARLSACFASLLAPRSGSASGSGSESASAPWVIVVGTDSPGLPEAELQAAQAWLGGGGSEPRAVLGPSLDGGYYLLGISAWQHGLLDQLPWSLPTTLKATCERLVSHGYALYETRQYFDVDDASDYRRLVAAARLPSFDAPATRALLRAWDSG